MTEVKIPKDPEAALTPKQAAAFLGISEITLWRRRRDGNGPRYYQEWSRGPVRYLRRDITEWLSSLERHSTSDFVSQPGQTRPRSSRHRQDA